MHAYTGSVPSTHAHPLDWMEHAACTDQRKIFDDNDREHEARTICIARCPVRPQCLAYMKEAERGLHRDQRESVAAGLTYSERFRLDPASTHRADDPGPIRFNGTERCGTHHALLKHLWLDEPIDPKCWSGEILREKGNRGLVLARRQARESEQAAERTQAQPVRPASTAARPKPPTQAKPTAAAVSRPAAPAKGDTPHERRVYRLWSEGCSDLQIARRMAISTPQVQRVRGRLGLLPNLHTRKAS